MQSTDNILSFEAPLRRFINSGVGGEPGAAPEAAFEELALQLFRRQFNCNDPYRVLCASRGVSPLDVTAWKQIPAVPALAFKEFEVSCLSAKERTHTFHSSGTTARGPGRHFHSARSLKLYEASLLAWFGKNFGWRSSPGLDPRSMIFLTPSREEAPNSSLVYMFETIRQTWGTAQSRFLGSMNPDGAWRVDFEAAIKALREACEAEKPVLLSGTAFSFVHLLDHLVETDLRFRLPQGSQVMETGGYKGQSRSVRRHQLHSMIQERFGVTPSQIICEYGMCELSSQAYASVQAPATDGVSRIFHFPPWARALVISAETGREVMDAKPGLLRIFDLANPYSVLAVQTEDLAVRHGNGFELIGRAEHVEPRGCSLMTA